MTDSYQDSDSLTLPPDGRETATRNYFGASKRTGELSFAVIIPAFNESATIRLVVEEVCKLAARVIVVDDGSTDGTAARLDGLPVRVIRHSLNRGKGSCLARGMRSAVDDGVDAVITIDADLQHRPEDIPRFVEAAMRHPDHIVLGNRNGSHALAPRLRRMANRLADYWISRACGMPVRDSQCGFRLYPRKVLESVSAQTERRHGFVFESEFLINASRRGFRIASVDVDAVYPAIADRASRYRPVADTLRITAMVAMKILRPARD